jgi:hypothetical protein
MPPQQVEALLDLVGGVLQLGAHRGFPGGRQQVAAAM